MQCMSCAASASLKNHREFNKFNIDNMLQKNNMLKLLKKQHIILLENEKALLDKNALLEKKTRFWKTLKKLSAKGIKRASGN